MPQDKYQTVQDVADRLGVAEATVRERSSLARFAPSTLAKAGAFLTPILRNF